MLRDPRTPAGPQTAASQTVVCQVLARDGDLCLPPREIRTARRLRLSGFDAIAACALRSSGLKTTSLKEEAVLGGALVARGEDGAIPQFDYAPHDEGAPRPARRTARDRSLRSSATRASPDPPRGGDPSAPRARAPSLIRWWLTAYACLTPWQASISRARPRAATMALWAAGRRMALFVAMLHIGLVYAFPGGRDFYSNISYLQLFAR